jgi:hypothetical protein
MNAPGQKISLIDRMVLSSTKCIIIFSASLFEIYFNPDENARLQEKKNSSNGSPRPKSQERAASSSWIQIHSLRRSENIVLFDVAKPGSEKDDSVETL